MVITYKTIINELTKNVFVWKSYGGGYAKHIHFLDLMAIFLLVYLLSVIILLRGIPDKYRPHNIYSQIIIVCKQSHGNKKSVFASSVFNKVKRIISPPTTIVDYLQINFHACFNCPETICRTWRFPPPHKLEKYFHWSLLIIWQQMWYKMRKNEKSPWKYWILND